MLCEPMGHTGTQVEFELDTIPNQAELPLKITIYRLIQEALNNAYRHAGGVGQQVHQYSEQGQLVVEISDRDPGFHPEQSGVENGRLGLSGMRERVESLGGLFQIESQPGKGTQILAQLPCHVDGGIDR